MPTVLRNSNIMRLLTWQLLSSRIDFEQTGYAVYKNLETLLFKVPNCKEYTTELHEVAILKLYGDNFNEIELTT